MTLTAQSTRLDGSVKGSNSADSAQLGESTRFSGSSLPAARGGASELGLGRFWRRRIPLVETFDLICNSVYFSTISDTTLLEMKHSHKTTFIQTQTNITRAHSLKTTTRYYNSLLLEFASLLT
ncbi:hypothetical protein Syun_007314 [Stephania yunnanensis]|uniref:Uncharacterized protein n=1 Tax=Stephania yunnanensis TaxID=152371 RepID=A0AAP0PYK5_9MAGN